MILDVILAVYEKESRAERRKTTSYAYKDKGNANSKMDYERGIVCCLQYIMAGMAMMTFLEHVRIERKDCSRTCIHELLISLSSLTILIGEANPATHAQKQG